MKKVELIQAIRKKENSQAYEDLTINELRHLVAKAGIAESTTMTKRQLISKLRMVDASPTTTQEVTQERSANTDPNKETVGFSGFVEVSQNPRTGVKTAKSTILVSNGAVSDRFPVIGKTVGAVRDILREILNISRTSMGIVNGKKVQDSYVLKPYDVLEFLKQAGSKG